MSTPLDLILAAIDASRTLDQVEGRVDRARNRFQHAAGRVTDMEAFEDLLGRFFAHVEAEVLRSTLLYEVDPGLYQYRAEELLREAYGPEGVKVGFEMARRGVEGGLRQVLNELGERLALGYARTEIEVRVYDWWDGLTATERWAATEEYLARFGHLLPGELTEAGGVRVRANFMPVLIEHPFLMRRMRRVGR